MEDLGDTQKEDQTVAQVDPTAVQEDQLAVQEDLTEAWEDRWVDWEVLHQPFFHIHSRELLILKSR